MYLLSYIRGLKGGFRDTKFHILILYFTNSYFAIPSIKPLCIFKEHQYRIFIPDKL